MEKVKDELGLEKDFNEVLLDTAIVVEKSPDKKLAYMIARKAGEITDIIIENFVTANVILPLDINKKVNIYRYLCAIIEGMKQFNVQIKEVESGRDYEA